MLPRAFSSPSRLGGLLTVLGGVAVRNRASLPVRKQGAQHAQRIVEQAGVGAPGVQQPEHHLHAPGCKQRGQEFQILPKAGGTLHVVLQPSGLQGRQTQRVPGLDQSTGRVSRQDTPGGGPVKIQVFLNQLLEAAVQAQ